MTARRTHAAPESTGVPSGGGKGASATPRFYTIEQVADALALSGRSVRRLIKAGKLRAHRFGAAIRISDADLRAFTAVSILVDFGKTLIEHMSLFYGTLPEKHRLSAPDRLGPPLTANGGKPCRKPPSRRSAPCSR
jgi:excisionase family DNA binding protein